jgi:hypothetical protein
METTECRTITEQTHNDSFHKNERKQMWAMDNAFK